MEVRIRTRGGLPDVKDFIAEFTSLLQAIALLGQPLIVALSDWLGWTLPAQAVAHAVLGILTYWQADIAKRHLPKETQLDAAELMETLQAYRKTRGLTPAKTLTLNVDDVEPVVVTPPHADPAATTAKREVR